MTDANNKTRTVTPAPASEKNEATPALDKIRRFKRSKARMREFQAREGDLWAFYRELRRQTEALSKQPAKDQAMLIAA